MSRRFCLCGMAWLELYDPKARVADRTQGGLRSSGARHVTPWCPHAAVWKTHLKDPSIGNMYPPGGSSTGHAHITSGGHVQTNAGALCKQMQEVCPCKQSYSRGAFLRGKQVLAWGVSSSQEKILMYVRNQKEVLGGETGAHHWGGPKKRAFLAG
jgi:hypothetical protein